MKEIEIKKDELPVVIKIDGKMFILRLDSDKNKVYLNKIN